MRRTRSLPRGAALGLSLALASMDHGARAAEPASPAPSATDGAKRPQDEDALTRELRLRFARGRALETVNRWADALEQFEAVARLRATPQVEFHVALCTEQLGRLLQARALYGALRQRAARAAPEVAAESEQRLAALAVRTPRLWIDLSGKTEGVEVLIDGRAVQPGRVERVDPGPHVVIVRRGELTVAAMALSIAEGRTRRALLRLH